LNSQTGRAHLLLVTTNPGGPEGARGVITLEGSGSHVWDSPAYLNVDIIEEIIAEEIVDETDQYEDMHTKRKAKRTSTAAIMRG
jgi:metal transporter CNNM